MKKVVYSEPTGGLCNRMGALNYAYLFAKKYDCKLVVLWKDNFEAACRFEEMFPDFDKDVKIINMVYYKKTPKELLKSGKIISFILRAIKHGAFDLYLKYRYTKELQFKYESEGLSRSEADAVNNQIFKEWYESNRKWCTISSYQCADLSHDYSVLRFARRYETAVCNMFSKQLGGFENDDDCLQYVKNNVVGVHVRRGDHKYAIEKNPLDGFIDKMKKVLEQNPDFKFYLASDGEDVIKIMRDMFPGKILINEGAELSRKSKAGMDNAVIDLLALSKTSQIIGSFGSTFSDMASYIGGNRLEYSTDEN